jgi:hypothetical protein
MSSTIKQVVFLYNKSNPYGISQDVKVLEKVLKKVGKVHIRHSDPLEPPIVCDLAIHFEVPIYSYYPWARMNVVVVNPEWWEDGWDSYLNRTEGLFFKCQKDSEVFLEKKGKYLANHAETWVLPWTTPITNSDFSKWPRSSATQQKECLWLLGASRNKREAAQKLLPLWKESYPKLHVYTTTPLEISTSLSSSVEITVSDLDEQQRRAKQAYYRIHLIFSKSEALGMAALEGQASGAFLLGNALPCYSELFCSDQNKNSFLTKADLQPCKGGLADSFSFLTEENLDSAIASLENLDYKIISISQSEQIQKRYLAFETSVKEVFETLFTSDYFKEQKTRLRTLPPILLDSELPKISVITLLHNRRRFVDLAFHNLLITDYPKEKIEWVVVEDSDKVEEQASDKIMKFARDCLEGGSDAGKNTKNLSVSYIPLPKPVSIGEKRNIAVERAQNHIILMMDDDDHYPPTSFRRRVSWLLKHPWAPECVTATTIACYDLLKGTSAVNTPPLTLPLSERVSEATLTFTKRFWNSNHFPTVNVAEGEGFLKGREKDVLEIQPQQIIVAMSHDKNASSRRIPQGPSAPHEGVERKPSCFWGFPKEFLIFLHRLAGVEIEEEKSSGKKK